jgi:hypothetical protein
MQLWRFTATCVAVGYGVASWVPTTAFTPPVLRSTRPFPAAPHLKPRYRRWYTSNGDNEERRTSTTNNNVDTVTSATDHTSRAVRDLDDALRTGALRQAVRVLRSHPDLELSRERWNAIFDAIEVRTANAEENSENLRALANTATEFPVQSAARQEMTDMYATLQAQRQLTLYGAVDTKLPLAAGSYNLPPSLLESILDLPMKALTPEPTNTLLLAGVGVAILEGILSLTTGVPLNLLVGATLLAAFVDRLFLNGAVFESFLKLFSPGIQTKILRHEAGHFLAAYVLGCPVEGIVLSAWAALQDRRFGARQVSAGTSFFDPELSAQINNQQAVKRSAVDRYSIIVMAGIAAEAEQYGRADGGAGDEMALVAFLSQLNGGRGGGPWNADAIRNQARWGALQAVLLLRHYRPAYDALVDALERGGSLGDCIHAIEKAARDHNLRPLAQPVGYIGEDESWSTVAPSSASTLDAATATGDVKGKDGRNDSPKAVQDFNEDESLATLQNYRATVEAKLREVEDQLSKLNESP